MAEPLDPGHLYRLICLDGSNEQILRFMKRGYVPHKHTLQDGTTCQDVLRVIHDRVEFLHQQERSWVNRPIRWLIRCAIWLFEYRAARRKGRSYWRTPWFATHAPMCPTCGHTDCREHH